MDEPKIDKSADSRLKGYFGTTTHAVLPLERTFCSNCGKPWGWASVESSHLIAAAEIIVCCEECFTGLNDKAGAVQIAPDEMKKLGLCEENIRDGF